MTTHLTVEQVGLFLAGELTGAPAGDVEAHIDGCESCRQLISETVRLRHASQAALAPTMISAASSLPVKVGDVVDGRYRIERLLGIGGMGCVFEAHHTHLNQRMALKFMLPDVSRDESAVDRFTREARAAVRLVTEHVGRVLDLGTLPSGTPYLVMEFLQGETVEQRLLREGPFQKAVAIRVVRAAIEALEEAHALGIVHRDVKPANLFLARRSSGLEVLKVLDFGIAKSIDPDIEAGLGNTSARMLLGSPLYMAPEQLKGGEVDARADVWALGCTLYQLLTGETPFRGADLVELMYAIQTRPHVSLAQRVPSLSAVSKVIDACLVKDPERRVASVVVLRRMLEEAERDAGVTAAHRGSRAGLPKWVPAMGVLGAMGLMALGALGWRRFQAPGSAASTSTAMVRPVTPQGQNDAPVRVPPAPNTAPPAATTQSAPAIDAGLVVSTGGAPAPAPASPKKALPQKVEPKTAPKPSRDVLDERL